MNYRISNVFVCYLIIKLVFCKLQCCYLYKNTNYFKFFFLIKNAICIVFPWMGPRVHTWGGHWEALGRSWECPGGLRVAHVGTVPSCTPSVDAKISTCQLSGCCYKKILKIINVCKLFQSS